ncbi:hypothetical protein O6H91_19G009000 [Diphasiastrum complanatum]|uniref:Uncharacterized protein n=1 Tax=Diphasiastrum complanatum TaxID=34168 RepID=A0ACC2ASP3_DIPCM|nr:hypothetical protein O6H91_19G009000 [Diphasiastrum complanatum]
MPKCSITEVVDSKKFSSVSIPATLSQNKRDRLQLAEMGLLNSTASLAILPIHVAQSGSSCAGKMKVTSNGAFQGDNPINAALPLLIIQICIVLALTRALGFLLRPLRQPRVIGEIIGGVLLGPSAFGRNQKYLNNIFPEKSMTVLETFADMGLLFFLFMVGLELDLRSLKKTGRHALIIATVGISVPFAAGMGVSVVLHKTIAKTDQFSAFLVFMGVAMSITAFPVLARILAERKLLTTDVGQLAMSAAAVNDVIAWILLALAVALSGSGKSPAIAAWVLLSGIGYLIFMFIVVRPIMAWISRRCQDVESAKEIYICITFAGMLISGFTTDVIGIHSIFGAFIFGLIIPKDGPFARILIEKVEDFVMVLMLPLYFAASGLKTNIGAIHGAQSGGLLVLVIATACLGKIFATFFVALAHRLTARKALTLGFLMNTKGLVELIVLNIGKERKVLNEETFAIMVIMALFTTFITTPIVMALYKPARAARPYTQKKLDMGNSSDELRILACVHGIKNVPAIINLIEMTRGTSNNPLRLYILHLVELSERSSAIMMVHRVRKNGRPFTNKNGTVEHIVVAFEAFGHLQKVTVRPMTAISDFGDMHDDICSTAAEKRSTIIILPFHKYLQADGTLETSNTGFRQVNQRVLEHAPCSVAILVDKGLGGFSQLPSSSGSVAYNVAVLFFGGPDDREAVAFGCRIAEHPGVKLTVIHLLPDTETHPIVVSSPESPDKTNMLTRNRTFPKLSSKSLMSGSLTFKDLQFRDSYQFATFGMDTEMESKFDEKCISAIRQKASDEVADGGQASVVYKEVLTQAPLESVLSIAKQNEFNLLLVGRARRPCQVIASLASLPMECSELGPIGDTLAFSSSEVAPCVLIFQQHDPTLTSQEHSNKFQNSSTLGADTSASTV